MTRTSSITISILAATLLLTAAWTAPCLAAGSPGEAGVLSLRLGVGAREAGMGEAGVASSLGASAVWWNPANNVFGDFETDVVVQHHRYLGLFNQEAAAVAHRMGKGVIGVMFTGFYSDEIVRYSDIPAAEPQGTFKPYDIALGVSYAHPLGDSFGVSATVKMVYEKIDIYSDSGVAFDLGVTHRAMIDGLVFAVAVTNLGGQLQLKDEPIDLPRTIRLGAAWAPPSMLDGKITVTADMLMPRDGTEKAHLGAEFRLIPELALRAGTRVNYESQGITAGAGFVVGRMGIDYAFSDFTTEGFDDGHKFSLRFTW